MINPGEEPEEISFNCPECEHSICITIPSMKDAPQDIKGCDPKKITLHAMTVCNCCGYPLKMNQDKSWSLIGPEELEDLPEKAKHMLAQQSSKIMIKNGSMKIGKDGKLVTVEKKEYSFHATAINPCVKEGSIMLESGEENYGPFFESSKNKVKLAMACYEMINALKAAPQNIQFN
jgi:hypothetical protein